MDQFVPIRPSKGSSKVLRVVGLVLAGTVLAALLVGWAAFLFWLAAEAAITLVHWF